MHGIFPIKPPIVSGAGLPAPISLGSTGLFHSSGGTDTLTLNASSNIQAGDLVVVAWFATTATTVSCSDGTNTYTKAATIANGATPNSTVELWYVANAAAVSSPAIAMNTTSSQTYLLNMGAARIPSSIVAPFDVAATAASSTGVTTLSATTAALAQANEIIFGVLGYPNFTSVTEGGGFTRIFLEHTNGNTLDLSYKNVSSTAGVTFNPTFAPSSAAGIVVGAFKRP